MNEENPGELIERIDSKEIQNVHGILIVKDGKLVFEEHAVVVEHIGNSQLGRPRFILLRQFAT
jgi:hypothetical protein